MGGDQGEGDMVSEGSKDKQRLPRYARNDRRGRNEKLIDGTIARIDNTL